jgi:uncharacterized protein (TIRG00374 family)
LNKKLKSILQLVVFAAIGVGLVWLSIHNIPDSEIEITKQSFKNADYLIVTLSAVISIFAHIMRAWRWNSMLQPMGHSISFKNSFAAVMIGYVVNYAVPRGGELSRCGVATRYEKVPFPAALGTVITERIVDVLMMLVLFFITLAVQYSELIRLIKELPKRPALKPLADRINFIFNNENAIIVWGMVLVCIALGLFLFRKKINTILKGKLGGIIKKFGEGIKSVKDLKNPFLFIFQSFLIWFFYFLSLYVCFWCFSETKDLGLKPALAVLLLGTLGVAISPGGIGLYQIIATEVLVFYGVTNGVQTSFPWIVWGAQFIAIIIIGGLCFLLLPLFNREKNGLSENT